MIPNEAKLANNINEAGPLLLFYATMGGNSHQIETIGFLCCVKETKTPWVVEVREGPK